MAEIWELAFSQNKAMWGFEAADSAILAKDIFLQNNIRNILIPGVGYGRNAKIFLENSINVTGIEISETAINIAKENKLDIKIYHSSVTDMPFDNQTYEGIFSYALIHLLNKKDRENFIKNSYYQLEDKGVMIFVAITKNNPMYGQGKELGKDFYEIFDGMPMFFYDLDSINNEFRDFGLTEVIEIKEPHNSMPNKDPFNFYFIRCIKS